MSASSTLQARPTHKRNVCLFDGLCPVALEECPCKQLRSMFAVPAATQADIDRERAYDEWLMDINCGELYGEVD